MASGLTEVPSIRPCLNSNTSVFPMNGAEEAELAVIIEVAE
jgi:hypothetical protein